MQFEPSRLANYDRPALIAEMLRVSKNFYDGSILTHKEFDRHSRVHSNTVAKEFGSWEGAWREAGFEYTRSRVEATDIVEDLKKVLKITGEYFSYRTYRQNGGLYNNETIGKRFKDVPWSKILEDVLGVRPKPRPVRERQIRQKNSKAKSLTGNSDERRMTPEQLLADLRSIASKTGTNILSYHDYRALGGEHCHATFYHVFGSWESAVRLIGLKDGKYKPRRPTLTYTKEDYFDELQRLWELLGRQPHARDMKANGSKMSTRALQARFGTWNRAIHAFCRDRNEPDKTVDTESSSITPETVTAEPSQTSSYTDNDSGPANKSLILRKKTPRNPSNRLRWKVFVRDQFKCQACGRSPANEPGVILEVDHIDPYSGDGETVLDNLRLLCWTCNSGKSNIPPNSPEVPRA